MELIRKSPGPIIKDFLHTLFKDNLLLFSSSIAYYSALALAPFMLILLWMASLIGQDVRNKIVAHAEKNFSAHVATMIETIFDNTGQGVNIGSISGLIGLSVLLWACSLVFVQFRYAFDVIYGNFNPHIEKSLLKLLRERLFAMFVVLLAALLLILSFTSTAVVEYFVAQHMDKLLLYRSVVFMLNFIFYLGIFFMIHYFAPGRRQRPKKVLIISAMSSVFFLLGNVILGMYLKHYAARSIYGATGTLLVFLIWAYYSSFTLFLSVEVYQYLEKLKKAPPISEGN